jgi:hypothetical protein
LRPRAGRYSAREQSRQDDAHEAARGRGVPTIQPAAMDHSLPRRIVREAAECQLAKQPCQQVTNVLAPAALRRLGTRQVGWHEHIIKFAMGRQSGARGDPAALEFQLQALVEINPKRAIIRFTRWVLHQRASNPATTH